MRIAALYDIHGNLTALDAVLADVEQAHVDRIVVGGDVVPGPQPLETLERLRALGDRALFVRGNGDRWVVEAFDALDGRGAEDPEPAQPWAAWTASVIDRRDRDFLGSFAGSVVLDLDGLGPTRLCHGSPRDDDEPLTVVTPERRWRPALAGVAEAVVVCGHTHAQFDRRLGPWRVVNAGSVGLPFEGRAGAFWLELGPGVRHRHVEYDLDRALTAMRACGGPDVDGLVRGSLVEPADPLTIAERLERQAADAGAGHL